MKLRYIGDPVDCLTVYKIYDTRIRMQQDADGKYYLQLTIPALEWRDAILTYHECYGTLKELAKHWEVPN